jgi:hypothetical protein
MVWYTRRSLGLLALFALVVSLAHTVWALCCIGDTAPFAASMLATEAGAVPIVSVERAISHGITDIDAAHHLHSPSHLASHRLPVPSGPLHDCPHGQADVMDGCAVAAAIPTGVVVVAAIPYGDQVPLGLSDTLPRILFGTDLFRPPRA